MPPPAGRLGDTADSAGVDRTLVAVVAVAVVALLLRVVALGDRPFHWDEARVGYWTLRYVATGAFEYRPVAGGPLPYLTTAHVFDLFGASDATGRLVVALVGGLAPLAALPFRGRLRDDETVAFALVLAATPLFLYYSRFLRGDLLLGTFGLVVVGCAFRLVDTGRPRYAYGGALALTAAVASSGFAVGYLVCWAVAAALTVDHAGLVDRPSAPATQVRRALGRLRGSSTVAARTVLVFAAGWLYWFAPRAPTADSPGLWRPTTILHVVEAAFVGAPSRFVGVRIAGRRDAGATHELVPYVFDTVGTLTAGALVLVTFAVGAFLVDRYRVEPSRSVVAFHAFWGGAALAVFPVVTEVSAPWVAVHVAVPLALPAAVGLASLFRVGTRAVDDADGATVGAVLLVVLALVVQTGGVAAAEVYAPPTPESHLAQYGQPVDDLDPFVANVSAAATETEGVDVLFVGDRYYSRLEAENDAPPVSDAWGERLPLPWYLERAGAKTASVRSVDELSTRETVPPVVVAAASERTRLATTLSGYDATEYRLALWNRRVVVFVEKGTGPSV